VEVETGLNDMLGPRRLTDPGSVPHIQRPRQAPGGCPGRAGSHEMEANGLESSSI